MKVLGFDISLNFANDCQNFIIFKFWDIIINIHNLYEKNGGFEVTWL